MFFFNKKETPEQLAEKEKQERSIKSLEMGGLPLRATERIERFKQSGGKLFTSDLTCNEHLLTNQAGYRPISQVMGSAFMNISLSGSWWGMSRSTGELNAYTDALMRARHLAVSRMEHEAVLLGAHGIIGVDLKVRTYDWDSRMIEVTAIGTAINVPGRPDGEMPFSSDLTGQEFWQLHNEGWWPASLVLGVSAYYVYTDQLTASRTVNFWFGQNANQEIPLYTEALHDARKYAMRRLQLQASECNAEGVVGAKVSHHIKEIEYETNKTTHHDLIITFEAIGTAIKRDEHPKEPAVKDRLIIMDLRRGSRHRLVELATEKYSETLIDDDDDFDGE